LTETEHKQGGGAEERERQAPLLSREPCNPGLHPRTLGS